MWAFIRMSMWCWIASGFAVPVVWMLDEWGLYIRKDAAAKARWQEARRARA